MGLNDPIMYLAMGQVPVVLGDIEKNLKKMEDLIQKAQSSTEDKVDLICIHFYCSHRRDYKSEYKQRFRPFSQYEYSKEDLNTTSNSYGEMVWNPTYNDYITLHYFTTQG